jgi:hypothetical protein
VASSTLTLNATGGSVTFASDQHLAALNLSGTGHAGIAPAASPVSPTIVTLGNLSIDHASGAVLDLTNNELLANTSATAIRSLIATGAVTTSTTGLALGYVALDASRVEVRATLLGDTNLDGNVDVADLGNLASSYGASSGALWVQGDTNYDGKVDVTDLGNLASNYGGQLVTAPSLDGGLAEVMSQVASVPEPAGLAIAGLLAVIATGSRRRRSV